MALQGLSTSHCKKKIVKSLTAILCIEEYKEE